jgi:hypothetical protein
VSVFTPARFSDPVFRPLWFIVGAALVLAGALALGRPYAHGASFVVQAADMDGVARRLAAFESTPVATVGYVVPWRGGRLRARAYQPLARTGRGILLVPGVHASGIDEPRLVGFAREIAAQGHPVLTVELPDLARYQITPRTTDMIEDAAVWTAGRREFTGRGVI